MYLAECSVLPGCRAWGETAEEALDYLESVAAASIESYRERSKELTREIIEAGELVVAV